MDIETFRDYCMSKKGATESIPFSKLPDLLVFKVGGKMFTAADMSEFNGFSIKCVPETIEELKSNYSCLSKPSYFSAKHWCSVKFDGTEDSHLLQSWLDISYDLVVGNLTKKTKAELELK